jgi:hypothetical protein
MKESVATVPLGLLATENQVTAEAREENPVMERWEERPKPSMSSAAPAMTKPLTRATITETDVMSAVVAILKWPD